MQPQPLDFSHLIACPVEHTKEKESDLQLATMRADLADESSDKHEVMRLVDESLREGMVSFSDLTRDKSDVSVEKNTHWSWLFPLSLYKSIDIYQLAHYLPRKLVWAKVFLGGYEMLGEDQRKFADIVFDYGQSVGLAVVGLELYNGASAGDPRAVKMYLEICGLLGEEEEDVTKKLMRVKIDI